MRISAKGRYGLAAMIAIAGCFKYLDKDFCSIDLPAYSRVTL